MTVSDVKIFALSEQGGDYSVSGKKSTVNNTKDADFMEVFEVADNGSVRAAEKKSVATAAATTDDKAEAHIDETSKDSLEVMKLKSKYSKLRDAALKEMSKNEVDGGSEAVVVTSEMLSALQELIADMLTKLADELGMTVEELQVTLDELGMDGMALLDADNLAKLVVEIEAGGDFTELLSNEELHNKLVTLSEELAELKDAFADKFGIEPEALEQMPEMNFADDMLTHTEQSSTTTDVTETSITEGEAATEVNVLGETRTENGDNSESSLLGEQNAFFGEVVNNIGQAVSEITDDSITADIVKQVIEEIKLQQTGELTSLELQLTPDELGKVNLQVIAKDGVVTARIATETLVAKEAIESQIVLLRESLNEQGIEIEDVEVVIASHQFEAENEDQRNNDTDEQTGRRRFVNVDELTIEEQQAEELVEAAAIAREIMMSNGNQMDIRG